MRWCYWYYAVRWYYGGCRCFDQVGDAMTGHHCGFGLCLPQLGESSSSLAGIVTKIGSNVRLKMVFVGPEPSKAHGRRGVLAPNFREDISKVFSPFFCTIRLCQRNFLNLFPSSDTGNLLVFVAGLQHMSHCLCAVRKQSGNRSSTEIPGFS